MAAPKVRCKKCKRLLKLDEDSLLVCVNKKCKLFGVAIEQDVLPDKVVDDSTDGVSTPVIQDEDSASSLSGGAGGPSVEKSATLKMKKREIVPAKIKERRIDRVPNYSRYPKITVHAYSIGHKGFRYTVALPKHVKSAWSKELTGAEATQFLRGVKTKNRHDRLESFTLPVEQK